MPWLAELQTRFADALRDPEKNGIDVWVQANGISAHRRIAVYRNNSRISQTEALAGIYSAVRQLVGEEFFEHMAEFYGAQHPSTSGDLCEYGSSFARFLSGFEPVAQLAYLPDVARLEWAWHECFHAGNAQSADAAMLNMLATGAGDHLSLSLIPASRLLASAYPVASIWEFALDPERQQQRLDLDVLDEAHLLIARPQDRVDVMELTPAQFFWLDRIKAGVTLTDLFVHTMEHDPDFDFAESLATFVGLGIIVIEPEASFTR